MRFRIANVRCAHIAIVAVFIFKAAVSHLLTGTDSVQALVIAGTGIAVVALSLDARKRAVVLWVAGSLRARVTVVTELISGGMLATELNIAGIDGARNRVVTCIFVQETVAVIVRTVANLLAGDLAVVLATIFGRAVKIPLILGTGGRLAISDHARTNERWLGHQTLDVTVTAMHGVRVMVGTGSAAGYMPGIGAGVKAISAHTDFVECALKLTCSAVGKIRVAIHFAPVGDVIVTGEKSRGAGDILAFALNTLANRIQRGAFSTEDDIGQTPAIRFGIADSAPVVRIMRAIGQTYVIHYTPLLVRLRGLAASIPQAQIRRTGQAIVAAIWRPHAVPGDAGVAVGAGIIVIAFS